MKRLIAAVFFLTSGALMGQGVLGVGNFIHVVANLDRSIEFYRDGIGLEMTGAPGPREFSANGIVSSLYNAPGAQSRVASFKIPDSNMAIEIVEFQGLNAPPVHPREFDPGAIRLTLSVKNLEETERRLYRIKALHATSAGRGSVGLVDPDGIFLSLVESRPALAGGPAPSAVQVGFNVAVADPQKTAQFYRNALGFTGDAGPKNARLYVPGDGFQVNFANPGWADAKAVHSAIHDPGSGVLRLRVSDFDAAVKALKAQGATVVSAGGEPVNLGRNRAVILRDLNNLFVQVLESAPAAAQGPAQK